MLKGKKKSAIFNKLDSKFKSKLENLFARRIPSVVTTSGSTSTTKVVDKKKKPKKIRISKPIPIIKEEPIHSIEKIEKEKKVEVQEETQNKYEHKNINNINNRKIENSKSKSTSVSTNENGTILKKLIELNTILLDKEIDNIKNKCVFDKNSFMIGFCISLLLFKCIF